MFNPLDSRTQLHHINSQLHHINFSCINSSQFADLPRHQYSSKFLIHFISPSSNQSAFKFHLKSIQAPFKTPSTCSQIYSSSIIVTLQFLSLYFYRTFSVPSQTFERPHLSDLTSIPQIYESFFQIHNFFPVPFHMSPYSLSLQPAYFF